MPPNKKKLNTFLKLKNNPEVVLMNFMDEMREENQQALTEMKDTISQKEVSIENSGMISQLLEKAVKKAQGDILETVVKDTKGDSGLQGIQGLMGVQGEKGSQGEKGLIGFTGKDGKDGKNGIGKDGIDGKDGSSFTFDKLTKKQKKELKGEKGDITGIEGIKNIKDNLGILDRRTRGLLRTGGGVTEFLKLKDTPDSYSGQALLTVRVNAAETALEFATAAGGGDMLLAGIQTVTGAKTFNSGKLIYAGATSGTITLNAIAVAGTNTLTLPASTDTLIGKATTDTLTNKTIDADGTGNTITNIGSSEIKSEMITGQTTVTAATGDFILITDGTDSNNLKKVNASDFLAGAGDMVLADVQTVTGAKTFGTIGGAVGKFILAGSTSGSTILNAAAVAGSTTVTLQGVTGTVALLGDKLDAFAATTSAELATVISDETGSGLLVFGTSPTLVTPALGTPSALVGTNITGSGASFNAGTATALETARTINGVSFDGTANITVTAAAGTLTGTTLNATVVSSSLTSVGTIGTGTWQGTTIAVDQGGTGQTTYTNGQLLIGNTTGNTLAKATLTGGTGITITNGTGTISIAADNNGTVTSVAAGNGLDFTTITTTGSVTLGTPGQLTGTSTNAVTATSHTHAIDDASLTQQGVVELATITETNTGTDATIAVTPDGLDGWTGSSQVTTLGTIATGVWNGTDIAVPDGGSGRGTATAFAVITGGTTSTGAHQSIASVGTSGQVLTSNGAGSLPTFQAGGGGGGITWNEVTGTSQTATVDNGFITNNASLVTITLPTTAVLGSVVRIAGSGAGGWKVAQNASEIIHFGSSDTTTGTGGSLASTNRYDAVELLNIVADTEWVVISSVGNVTII